MSAADANSLFNALVASANFTIPNIDLSGPEFTIPGGTDSVVYRELTKLSNSDVTTKQVDGSGAFDWFMSAFKAHLREEYDAGRITGAQYVEAYIALTQTAMTQAVQFLIGRDAAFWQAAQTQAQTITARVGLALAKAQYAGAQADAYTKQAQFALTKMQIPLVSEQGEVQRGQTTDQRTDGQPVTGVLGKQKELLTQQKTSYMRDAEMKGAKLFADGWTVQKTADEGLTPPNAFTNETVNEVLQTLRSNLGLVA